MKGEHGYGVMKGAGFAPGRRSRSSTPASPPLRRSSFNASSDHPSSGSLRRIVFKDLDDSTPSSSYRTSVLHTASSNPPLHVNDPLCPVSQRRSSLPASFSHRNSTLASSDKLLGRFRTPAIKCSNEAAAPSNLEGIHTPFRKYSVEAAPDSLGGVHTPAGKCSHGAAAGNNTSAIQSNRFLGRIHTLASKCSNDTAADTQLGHVPTSSEKCCNGVGVSKTIASEGSRLLGRTPVPSSNCSIEDAAISATADLVRRTKGDAPDNGHPFGMHQQRRFSSPAALPSSRAYAGASSSSSSSSSSFLLHNHSSRSSISKGPSAVRSMLASKLSAQKSDSTPSFRRFSIDNVVNSASSPANSTSSFAAKSTDPLNSSADENLDTRLRRMTLRSDTALRAAEDDYYGDDDVIVKGKSSRKAYKGYEDYDESDDIKDSTGANDNALCLANNEAEVNNMHPLGLLCIVGLYNEGNTCYLNSCLQCLVHTMPLAAAMLSGQAYNYSNKGAAKERTRMSVRSPRRASSSLFDNTDHLVSARRSADASRLATEFGNLLKDMWSSSRAPYSVASAAAFLRSLQSWEPQFSGHQQQDAQEAMRAILDGLHESLNQVKSRKYKDMYREYETRREEELADIMWDYHRSLNDSIIQDIFCGQLQSSIECSVCKTTSHCFDPFLDLSLPVPENGKSLLGGRYKGSPINKWRVSIQDCLALFAAPETLSGHDRYTCATCKVPRLSTKKLSIYRAPTILVLHLKRFEGSGGVSYRKDETPISYPLRGLDLTEFLGITSQRNHASGALYDLYGVCHHSGTIGFGHYTAQCKSNDGLWYSFNDSLVSHSHESTVVSSSAYILFYQLRYT